MSSNFAMNKNSYYSSSEVTMSNTDILSTTSINNMKNQFSHHDSLLSPVAGFMDYDPKYAASISHRVNKRAAVVNLISLFCSRHALFNI